MRDQQNVNVTQVVDVRSATRAAEKWVEELLGEDPDINNPKVKAWLAKNLAARKFDLEPAKELERLTYTVEETAQLLRVSRSVAYEAVRTGRIPSIKLGRRVLVPVKGLRDLLAGGAL